MLIPEAPVEPAWVPRVPTVLEPWLALAFAKTATAASLTTA